MLSPRGQRPVAAVFGGGAGQRRRRFGETERFGDDVPQAILPDVVDEDAVIDGVRLEGDDGPAAGHMAGDGQRVQADVGADIEEHAVGRQHAARQPHNLGVVAAEARPVDVLLHLDAEVERDPADPGQVEGDLLGGEQSIQRRGDAPASLDGQRTNEAGERIAEKAR